MDLVAVTGSTGNIGRRVAGRLAAAGVPLRLVVRDHARAPRLDGASTATAAGYSDVDSMRSALDGAATLFLVSGRENADRVREHRCAVDAAIAAGVGRIVYTSFLGAAPDATFTFARDHWHTERYIEATGVAFTFLRDSLYQASLAYMASADGVIRGPAGEGRVSAVAFDDVADVAVAVMLGTGHDGRTYDVTGPEALTLDEVAAELSLAVGRPIRYEPETIEEAYASRAHYGAPEFEVAGWVTSYVAIATGEMATVSDAVPRVAGRPAQDFADFLTRNPGAYVHLL